MSGSDAIGSGPSGIVRATVAADGRLLSADAPLLALQKQAGADLDDMLAIPQLASIARLCGRLGMMISRPVVAASRHSLIDMWVRARPEGGEIHLAIVDWHERPGADRMTDAGRREADIALLPDGWNWTIDPQMRFVTAFAGEGAGGALPDPSPTLGMRLSAYFRLMPDDMGDMAILEGLALRRAFVGQLALLTGALGAPYRLSGQPMFDLAGRLTGYRGRAVPDMRESNEGDVQGVPAPELDIIPIAFGKRLDRSLRRPLGRIIANADSISAQLEGPLRPDYADYASDIAAAGRHLMALVDDLADLQAVDRPDFSVAVEEVDLADLGRRAAGLLSVKALDRRIEILAPGAGESVPALGEFRRVLQILVNLIGNAIRYSPEGTQVHVRAGSHAGRATILVADQGPGIPVEAQARLFLKFERLGRDDPGGSGLGLYISRRLARAMGGDILLESEAGEGARFVLTLPQT
ncbi:MAG: HAMP domain-containing sensor histidine kinase [Sphingobium sp.]